MVCRLLLDPQNQALSFIGRIVQNVLLNLPSRHRRFGEEVYILILGVFVSVLARGPGTKWQRLVLVLVLPVINFSGPRVALCVIVGTNPRLCFDLSRLFTR